MTALLFCVDVEFVGLDGEAFGFCFCHYSETSADHFGSNGEYAFAGNVNAVDGFAVHEDLNVRGIFRPLAYDEGDRRACSHVDDVEFPLA